MREFSRVFGRNTLILLAVMLVINAGLFMLSCSEERDITLTGEALEEYISGYPAYLEKTRENSAALSSLPMYQSGFAAENVRKTAESYARLEGAQPRSGDNRGIVLLLQYRMSDLFLTAILVMLSVSLLDERKKGLVYMVRSTQRGRGILYFQRVAILAATSAGASLLLCGGNTVGMLMTFGGCDLTRSIQSLPEFMQCPYNITIGGYLAATLAIRAAGCFAAALLFFLLISVLGTAAAYTAAALLTAGELLLYLLVPPVSSMNALRYINLFMLIGGEEYFSACRFLNIFGEAVPALDCALVCLAALTVILTALGYFIHAKCYVSGRNVMERFIGKVSALMEKLSVQHTLLGWESRKLLIKQGGLFFITAAFLLALFSALQYEYYYPQSKYERMWYERYNGEMTEEMLTRMERDMTKLIDHDRELNAHLDNIAAGLEDGANVDSLIVMIKENKERKEALEPILENVRNGLSYTERTGHALTLIKPYVYDLIFKKDKKTVERASFCILIGIIGGISGIYAYERRSGMSGTIRSSYRGRGHVTAAKTCLVLVFCLTLCVSVHALQLVQVDRTFGLNDLSVPLQSLRFMRDFPIYMSISDFIVLLFAARALAACAIGLICSAVSRLCADPSSAMGANAFVLAVPSVFAESVSGFSFISAVYLLGAEYLL